MTAPIPRIKAYDGPPILSYGFRPFFLVGAIYSAVAILMWLPRYFGELTFVTVFSPLAWHAHEMLFGFIPAIITGFLLTAIPNWTGRLPLQGPPLLALLVVWVLGRIAIAFSGFFGWLPVMALDCAFILMVEAAIAREIIAGKNWRNLKVLAILSLLLASNIAFHLEAHYTGSVAYAERIGVAVVLILVVVIGGRIVPSFTHNWLTKTRDNRMPALTERADQAIIATTVAALLAWVIDPSSWLAGIALGLAGVSQAIRLASWRGWRAWRNSLVLVLHAAYAFVPVGFVLSATAAFYPSIISSSAGVHAWTAGAMGGMILAVMTRASLGHTGRELRADLITNCVFMAVFISALTRIAAALQPDHAMTLLIISGVAWIGAFLGFAIAYGPLLLKPRL